MSLETSTINVLLTAILGLQAWMVMTIADLRAEVRNLKARVE